MISTQDKRARISYTFRSSPYVDSRSGPEGEQSGLSFLIVLLPRSRGPNCVSCRRGGLALAGGGRGIDAAAAHGAFSHPGGVLLRSRKPQTRDMVNATSAFRTPYRSVAEPWSDQSLRQACGAYCVRAQFRAGAHAIGLALVDPPAHRRDRRRRVDRNPPHKLNPENKSQCVLKQAPRPGRHSADRR